VHDFHVISSSHLTADYGCHDSEHLRLQILLSRDFDQDNDVFLRASDRRTMRLATGQIAVSLYNGETWTWLHRSRVLWRTVCWQTRL